MSTFDVRIGINPLSWMTTTCLSRRRNTAERGLTEGKQIGYEGFELGNKFPREPDALKRCSPDMTSHSSPAGIPGGSRTQRRGRDRGRGSHLDLLVKKRCNGHGLRRSLGSIQGHRDRCISDRVFSPMIVGTSTQHA